MMSKVIILLTLSLILITSCSNKESKVESKIEIETESKTESETEAQPLETPLVTAEIMPQFPEGDDALIEYLMKETQCSQNAKNNPKQGRVIVKFVVEKDGSISNPEIVKGLEVQYEKEAIRIVKAMPKWTSGKQNDTTVRVYYTLPIGFNL